MGNNTEKNQAYVVPLIDNSGQEWIVHAYGIEHATAEIGQFNVAKVTYLCRKGKDMATVYINIQHDNTASSAFTEANNILYGYNYPALPFTPLRNPISTSMSTATPFTLPPPSP